MSYVNAEDVLPKTLIEEIQKACRRAADLYSKKK